MKKYILRLGTIAIICLVIANLVKFFIPVDYYWGNKEFKGKIEFLENKLKKQNLDYNVYFFGSSRVFRQINPSVFDSLSFDKNLKSYNLGAKGTFAPQTYYLYRNFLESKLALETDYVFLELSDFFPSGKRNFGSDRSSYWQNWKDCSFMLKSLIKNDSNSFKDKVTILSTNYISYFLKLFQFTQFKRYLVNNTIPNKTISAYVSDNGFQSLDEELVTSVDSLNISKLLIRKQGITNGKYENNLKDAANAFETKASVDNVHLNVINDLIQVSNEKGIRLIFLLPPSRPTKNLVSLYDNIDSKNKIEVANPKVHFDIYQKNNFFDEGHLNSNGAILLTKKMTQKFNSLVFKTSQ